MSTNWPNQEKFVYGIVCGGDDKDPDPTESGGVRVYIPSEYGPGVKRTHLPMARVMTQGSQEGITRFNPPPERGAAVLCMKMPGQSGTGHLVVLGTIPNDINNDDTVPGNLSLMGFLPVLLQAIAHKVNILIPPKIVEKNKRGALVRVPIEKGVKHSHKLLKGIPSTGTQYHLLGYPIPRMHTISTAIDAFVALVTKEGIDKLVGVKIDVASILELLPIKVVTELEEILGEGIFNALRATTNLMQSMAMVETSGFYTSHRVNEKVYYANVISLLKELKDVKDIGIAIRRLQTDTSLFGIEEIVDAIKIKRPDVDEAELLSPEFLIPKEVEELIEMFLKLFQDAGFFPSVLPDKEPFFGESIETILEMLPRLTPKELTKRVELLLNGVSDQNALRKRLNDWQRKVTLGGNLMVMGGGAAATAEAEGEYVYGTEYGPDKPEFEAPESIESEDVPRAAQVTAYPRKPRKLRPTVGVVL